MDDDDSDSSNDNTTVVVKNKIKSNNNINTAAGVDITNDDSMSTVSSKDTIIKRRKKITTSTVDTKNQHDFSTDHNQQLLNLANYGLLAASHHPGSYGYGLAALGNLPFITQSGFNFLPNYNNPNMLSYPTFINMSQPTTSSPINNKRKRDLVGTSYTDDEISNRIAPILNGLYNSHADLSSFLNTQHDNNGHKLAQHARGTRKQGGDNRRKRGNCRQCPNTVDGKRNARQTSYYCTQCDVSLHPDCFHLFHSKNLQKSETVESKKIKNNSETTNEQIATTNDPVATTNDSVATTNDSVATTNDPVATTCNNLLPVH